MLGGDGGCCVWAGGDTAPLILCVCVCPFPVRWGYPCQAHHASTNLEEGFGVPGRCQPYWAPGMGWQQWSWGTWEGPRGTGSSLGWLVSSFPCLFSIMGLGIGVSQVTCGQVPLSPAVLGAGCEGRSQAPSCGHQLLPGLLKPGPLHVSLAEQQDGAQDPKNVAEKEKGRGCPAKHAAETVLRPRGPHCVPHTRAARAGLAPGPPLLFPWG